MRNFEHFFDLFNMMYKHRKGGNKAHAVKVWEINRVGGLTQVDQLLFFRAAKIA